MANLRRRFPFLPAPEAAAAAICLLMAPFVRGQSFEVASIKPSVAWKAGGEGGSSRSQTEHTADTLTMRNIDVNEMVQWAYGLQPYLISGQNVLADRRYDV